MITGTFFRKTLISPPLFIILALYFATGCREKDEAGKDWPVYLGGNSSNQYSPLDQINLNNVRQLKAAWEFHSGDDISDNDTQIQCNALIIDGKLYGTSPKLKVFALNAANGKEIWMFDPHPDVNFAMNVNRGVAYWSNGKDTRILFTAGPDLYALDAENGRPVLSFGDSGKVSLREGLGGQADEKYVVATSPGIVYKDLIILGSRVSENFGAAPGFIRAFNIEDGHLEWVFHTIPRPGEYGYDTWPDSAYETAGGANAWSGMSLDERKGIVYVPTGSAAFDFWGGNRKGANLFANCVLALDARTGERLWHFQTVHHDLWDRDVPAPPNLVTIRLNGRKTEAVAQITKSGFVFVLDRITGKPLFPVIEKPVPPSDLDGEEAWPTQPFPQLPPPFSPQTLTQKNITNINNQSHDYVSNILKKTRTGRQFIPPSTQGTVIFPGFDGGGEWGGAAFDPSSGYLYVNGSVMPWILTMVKIDSSGEAKNNPGEQAYYINCAVCHGRDRKGTPGGIYPPLVDISAKYAESEILNIINTGKGFMPSFKNLDETVKANIVAYLTGRKPGYKAHAAGLNKQNSRIPYTHTGYNRFLDQYGYPAVSPPWGTISAVDLNQGSIVWQVPLGEFEELTQKGIPKTGTENYGGPVVTAGGLVFIGASKDGYFRAFNKENGAEVWKYKLPAGGYATPSVYMANGKEYVVIACGGGKMGTPSGDSYIAFSLAD